jgi:hypothetical protein
LLLHQSYCTEWEIQLRPICQKVRVVENLLGGPHLVVTGSPSVAVRIYNADDAQRYEGIIASGKLNDVTSDEDDFGVDGLRNFRNKYEHSVVIFVLPTSQQQRDQLGRRDSFVNTAQRDLLSHDDDKAAVSDQENYDRQKKKHTSRTVIVNDTSQALSTIDSVVRSLLPEKRTKRKQYFEQVGKQSFLPGGGATQEVIANHVSKTFYEWAARFEMPDGDSNVVLSVLGSLGKVTTADRRMLDDVPVRNASKDLILNFFGDKTEEMEMAVAQSEQCDFIDDIDDSELRGCPDPSTINTNVEQQTPFPYRYNNYDQSTAEVEVHHNLPFAFTPMVPPQQFGHHSTTSSIIPDSFSVQQGRQFSHTRQMLSDSGYQPVVHHNAHRRPPPGTRHLAPSETREGYSVIERWGRGYPQQFM